MMKSLAMALVLVALAACNTMRGAGQDVQDAGSALSDQAAETQSEM